MITHKPNNFSTVNCTDLGTATGFCRIFAISFKSSERSFYGRLYCVVSNSEWRYGHYHNKTQVRLKPLHCKDSAKSCSSSPKPQLTWRQRDGWLIKSTVVLEFSLAVMQGHCNHCKFDSREVDSPCVQYSTRCGQASTHDNSHLPAKQVWQEPSHQGSTEAANREQGHYQPLHNGGMEQNFPNAQPHASHTWINKGLGFITSSLRNQ